MNIITRKVRLVPFPNPYVTDGLVAMWDGEWNSNWMHDSSATTWTDVVHGLEVYPYAGTIEFRQNYVKKNQGAEISLPRSVAEAILGDMTLEIVNEALSSAQDVAKLHISDDGDILHVWEGNGGHACISARWGGATQQPLPIATKPRYPRYLWTVTLDGRLAKGFCNGKLLSSRNDILAERPTSLSGHASHTMLSKKNGSAISNAACNCYCYRLYNRALSPQEIAHNFTVDNARFKLA